MKKNLLYILFLFTINLSFGQQKSVVVKKDSVELEQRKFDTSSLEKYKSQKGNFIKAFFIGLKSNIKAMSTKEYSSIIYIIKNK